MPATCYGTFGREFAKFVRNSYEFRTDFVQNAYKMRANLADWYENHANVTSVAAIAARADCEINLNLQICTKFVPISYQFGTNFYKFENLAQIYRDSREIHACMHLVNSCCFHSD